ncbi:MAG TPA: putative maltokinase [Nitrospiraceae bacterium]
MLNAMQGWERPFKGDTDEALAKTLPNVLQTRRWFGGKARRIETVRIVESIVIPTGSVTKLLLICVEYENGGGEMYTLPVTAAFGEEADRIQRDFPQAVIAPLMVQHNGREQPGLMYEALWNRDFTLALLQAIRQGARFNGFEGCLIASCTNAFADLVPVEVPLEPAVMKADQSNTSIVYGGSVVLKLYRRLEEGTNLDVEIGRVLTNMHFPYTPPIAGVLEYQRESGKRFTLALLQQFVRNDGDAWRYSLEAVDQFIARVIAGKLGDERPPKNDLTLLDLARNDYPLLARQLIGPYLESAERLGQRTAELHLALSQVVDDPAFVLEPLTMEYRRERYDSMVRSMAGTLALLQERMERLSTIGQASAQRLFNLKPALEQTFNSFKNLESPIPRIRCHGDYHLGQLLCTGTDFMIIDFEGEPARSLAERRTKHPALMDVAGMIRSFYYAPFAFLEEKRIGVAVASPATPPESVMWARFWSEWASAAFLKSYLGIAAGARFWPKNGKDVRLLLDVYLVEKATYELQYELNNRPHWVEIPLQGLVEILNTTGRASCDRA